MWIHKVYMGPLACPEAAIRWACWALLRHVGWCKVKGYSLTLLQQVSCKVCHVDFFLRGTLVQLALRVAGLA